MKDPELLRDLYLVRPQAAEWATGDGPRLLALSLVHEEEVDGTVEWLIGLTEDDARLLLGLLKRKLETP